MTASTFSRCAYSSRRARPIQIACSMKVAFILRLRPVITLSSTDMLLNRAMFWNVRAIPCAAASCVFMSWRTRPRKVIVPCCGR